MGILNNWYNREPKNEIKKDAPEKKGMALFFDVFFREFWELCKLNLIFIVFCLPVVTIPTAITAMSKVMMYMIMDRTVYTFSDFFQSFKAEWKRATVAGLFYFPLLALTVFGQLFYSAVAGSLFLYVVTMLLCAMVLIAGFYLFPMLAVLDLSLNNIFKNAFLLTFLRMPQNILTLFISALLFLLVWLFWPFTFFALLLIFFALTRFITTFCAYTGLKKYVLKESDKDNAEV